MLDAIYEYVCTNSIKNYIGMINLKTRVVISSDKRGKWDRKGFYMGMSALPEMLP